jgi:Mg2+/Co2+ transporter CorB
VDRQSATREQIRALVKEPLFIPETTTLKDQLENFRRTRTHIGIVVDEYGTLMGLVTLEDILEEIVGQIDDEHDKVIRGIKRQKDGSYIVRGNLNIRDLNREMDWSLPVEDYATVAGLVIRIAENIPEINDRFNYEDFEFMVMGKIRNQITSVKINHIPKESDEQE